MKPPIIKAIQPKFLKAFLAAKAEARQLEHQLNAWHCGHLLRDDPDELRGQLNSAVVDAIEAYQLCLKRLASHREFHSVRYVVQRTPTTVRIGKVVLRFGSPKDKSITRLDRWLRASTAVTRLKGNEWSVSTRRLADHVLQFWEEQHRPQKRRRHGKAR